MKLIFHFSGQLCWRLNEYRFQAYAYGLHIHNVACTYFLFHCSYSLYEPKDIVLSEYKGGLEKAILKNSTLLVQLNARRTHG